MKLFQHPGRYSHEQFPLSGKPGERDHHKLIRSLPRCQIPATVDSIWLPRCSKAAANGFPHLSFPSVSGFKKNLPSGQGKLVLRNWAPSSLLGQQKGWEEVVPKVAVFPVTVIQL